MAQAGKIHIAIEEMKRMNIKVMGVREIRWSGSGQLNIDDYKVYYSGTTNGEHQHGVEDM